MEIIGSSEIEHEQYIILELCNLIFLQPPLDCFW